MATGEANIQDLKGKWNVGMMESEKHWNIGIMGEKSIEKNPSFHFSIFPLFLGFLDSIIPLLRFFALFP
jgi:hypothetical protein